MAERVIRTYRPPPGSSVEDFEIPGPGLYEADFDIPGWLLPDFDARREFSVNHSDKRFTHERTFVRGSVLTVRFLVTDRQTAGVPEPQAAALLGPLTVAVVARAVFGVVLGTLAVLIIRSLVQGVRELRLLGETPAGGVLTFGVAAVAIAGAALIFARR